MQQEPLELLSSKHQRISLVECKAKVLHNAKKISFCSVIISTFVEGNVSKNVVYLRKAYTQIYPAATAFSKEGTSRALKNNFINASENCEKENLIKSEKLVKNKDGSKVKKALLHFVFLHAHLFAISRPLLAQSGCTILFIVLNSFLPMHSMTSNLSSILAQSCLVCAYH